MLGLEAMVAFVAVTDLDRASQFYGDVLGLPLHDERPYALSATVAGTHLRITLVEQLPAAPYTVFGFMVTDIAAAVDDLAGRGVVFTRYDGMGQDDRGIWTSPSRAQVAWFPDPDGNNLSLTQAAFS